MYSLSQISKGIRQPYLILREFNAAASRGFRFSSYEPDGVDIYEEDWDNLIILDACRYDKYQQLSTFEGTEEYRTSKATATKDFIRYNFLGRKLHDTVYVTGNSWVLEQGADSNLYLVYDVISGPDEEGKTKPELITECAKEAAMKYETKRLIVHYIRPHHPFIGERARRVFSGSQDQPPDLYNKIQSNKFDIDDELLHELYEENLQIALEQIEDLLDELEGKTVITADHGELLGERVGLLPMKTYGHPSGYYVDELTTVPWHVLNQGERRLIQEDEPIEEPDMSYATREYPLEERLKELGYRR